jgi:hypothetical protein
MLHFATPDRASPAAPSPPNPERQTPNAAALPNALSPCFNFLEDINDLRGFFGVSELIA